MFLRAISKFLILSALLRGLNFQDTIPENLLECYNDSVKLMPMTIKNFIDIIKKIETQELFLMDMNTIVNFLMQRYWRDGIELDRKIIVLEPDVIPYRTTGFQSYKYDLIKHKIMPQLSSHLSNEELTSPEKCTIHRMLSGSVDIWERGNEYSVCKIHHDSDITNFGSTGFRKSSCPIEHGIISTKYYGTISPIHILLAIAAELEPMNIPLTYLLVDKEGSLQNLSISIKWITLIGELSETFLIQTPLTKNEYQFGPSGNWNDSDVPTEYYMTLSKDALQKQFWQYTDAEILGTLDGLIMAGEARKWDDQGRLLRLSQLLEAYYSKTYKFYSISAHVCIRRHFFESLINRKKEIVSQVQTFVKVLHQNMPNYINNTSIINTQAERLVDQFINYAQDMIWNNNKCPEGVQMQPKFKITVVSDVSWTSYKTMKFLTALGEIADINKLGSQLTVIDGVSGKIIVDSENSLGNMYLNWNLTDMNGTPSIVRSLITIRNNVLSNRHSSTESSESFNYLTIILCMSTILGNNDISDAVNLLNSIRRKNPDMNFKYITSTPYAPMYVKLTSAEGSQTDNIITFDGNIKTNIIEELGLLSHYPMAITPSACGNFSNQMSTVDLNAYANQGTILFYRIHPRYLCKSKSLVIEIENGNKGNLIACISREQEKHFQECKEISISEKLVFYIRNPCSSGIIYEKNEGWNEDCKPVFIHISGKRSLSMCNDLQCRMPDDIPFKLIVNGMKCIAENGPQCNESGTISKNYKYIILLQIFVLKILHS